MEKLTAMACIKTIKKSLHSRANGKTQNLQREY